MQVTMTMEEYEDLTFKNKRVIEDLKEKHSSEILAMSSKLMLETRKLRQDKELYNYTQKLLRDIFRLRITDITKDTRIVTAEGDHKGVLLRVIDILRDKYTFSVVLEKKK